MEPILRLKNVSKSFSEHPGKTLLAVKNITLDIFEGELFMFVGPSGCGKSTLLRMMSGLEKDYTGSITLQENVTRNDFSFVFQQFALLPWLTVEENVELGLIARHVPPSARKRRVTRELKQLGLSKFAEARIHELSGGMRQRVGIARAFATDPKVIFMDEPFSELDSFTAEELRQELLGIWREKKPTIVMVTHLVPEAIELADRIAVFTSRPGRIEKIIENNLPRPRSKRSNDFFRLEDEVTNIIKP